MHMLILCWMELSRDHFLARKSLVFRPFVLLLYPSFFFINAQAADCVSFLFFRFCILFALYAAAACVYAALL